MDCGQLVSVILDAYDARKEFKEYFEYFLNPQPEKLLKKHKAAILKELGRTSRGRSKARISRIRQHIADFRSFQPGYECVAGIYIYTIVSIAATDYRLFLPAPLVNGTAKIITEYVAFANESGNITDCREQLDRIIKSSATRRHFRNFMLDSAQEAFAALRK